MNILETLSRLSTMLMNPDFKNSLVKAKSEDEVLNLINESGRRKIRR